MVEAVEIYTEYVERNITEALTQADIDLNMIVEQWLDLTSLGVEGLDGGTADCILIDKEHQHIEVIDYKHGQGVAVEVEGNTQAMCYAIGAMIKLGVKEEWEVTMTIVQPRKPHPDGVIRSHTMKSEDLWDWAYDELIPKAKMTHLDDAPLGASEKACKFCPVATCTERNKRVQEVALADFDEVSSTLPDPKMMTPEQKSFIAKNAKMITDFIKAVESSVTGEMVKGSEDYEEDFKLVRKTTRRKLYDEALDPIASPLFDHLKEEELYESKPISLTEIEKKLKKKIGAKDAKSVMEEVAFKPEGELVMAPISDNRKAVAPPVKSDFENI